MLRNKGYPRTHAVLSALEQGISRTQQCQDHRNDYTNDRADMMRRHIPPVQTQPLSYNQGAAPNARLISQELCELDSIEGVWTKKAAWTGVTLTVVASQVIFR